MGGRGGGEARGTATKGKVQPPAPVSQFIFFFMSHQYDFPDQALDGRFDSLLDIYRYIFFFLFHNNKSDNNSSNHFVTPFPLSVLIDKKPREK